MEESPSNSPAEWLMFNVHAVPDKGHTRLFVETEVNGAVHPYTGNWTQELFCQRKRGGHTSRQASTEVHQSSVHRGASEGVGRTIGHRSLQWPRSAAATASRTGKFQVYHAPLIRTRAAINTDFLLEWLQPQRFFNR